jgi:hypothetical protein
MNSPSQNKNQKNPTHEKPVPATVLPNNLDTETKTYFVNGHFLSLFS